MVKYRVVQDRGVRIEGNGNGFRERNREFGSGNKIGYRNGGNNGHNNDENYRNDCSNFRGNKKVLETIVGRRLELAAIFQFNC